MSESRYLLVPAEGDIDEDEGLTKKEIWQMLNNDLHGHQRPFMLTVAIEGRHVPITVYGYGTDPVDAYQTAAPDNAVALISAFEMDELQYEQMT